MKEQLHNPDNPFLDYLLRKIEEKEEQAKLIKENSERIARIEKGIIWVSGIIAVISLLVSKAGVSRVLALFG